MLKNKRRHGGSTVTYSGIRFYHLDPHPEEISIFDMAHALSNVCRWQGHCRVFYSDAQHCLLVSQVLEWWGLGPLAQLEGLLHDGSEAYIADVSHALKHAPPMAPYRRAEKKLQGMIFSKFLPAPLTSREIYESTLVKPADRAVAALEFKKLFSEKLPDFWPDNYKNLIVPKVHFYPLQPETVEQLWLNRFANLRHDVMAGRL